MPYSLSQIAAGTNRAATRDASVEKGDSYRQHWEAET